MRLLTLAQRARTVLAMNGLATWQLVTDNAARSSPFIEQDGTPLLLVEPEWAGRLLDPDDAEVVLSRETIKGSITLSGQPRPPSVQELAGELATFRGEHASCGQDCRAYGSVPVALDVRRMAVAEPRSHCRPTEVGIEEFLAAEPDWWSVGTGSVAEHLSGEHAHELIQLAAAHSGFPVGAVLTSTVVDITPDALLLTSINTEGALDIDISFRRPLITIQHLHDELHALLHDFEDYSDHDHA